MATQVQIDAQTQKNESAFDLMMDTLLEMSHEWGRSTFQDAALQVVLDYFTTHGNADMLGAMFRNEVG